MPTASQVSPTQRVAIIQAGYRELCVAGHGSKICATYADRCEIAPERRAAVSSLRSFLASLALRPKNM